MLPLIASIVTTLVANKLPGVANAVIDKGLDYVQDKLGVELKPEMSPEEIEKIRQEAVKHEEFRIEQANKNTADARDMNVKIQETDKASFLAKNTAFILDFIIVISTIVLTVIAFFVGIPMENKEIVFTLVGSLWTYCGVVINFHRGSSAGSEKKTELLKGK